MADAASDLTTANRQHRSPPGATQVATSLRFTGRVQGVGFRPFVVRLARQHRVAGTVRNLLGEVEIVAEAAPDDLEVFVRELIANAPPLAAPRLMARETIAATGRTEFAILESSAAASASIYVPPDHFTCDDCLRELEDPADPRFGYPFINCTQCGPRYTLIEALPYDRPNTTMARFALCERCNADYRNPADRRFHAEPLSCPVCGPQVRFERGNEVVRGTEAVLARAVELLHAGAVLAVKGIGGYHLMCDASSEAAVALLRKRKHRPHKPLAVMFAQRGADGLDAVREHLDVDADSGVALRDPTRPIVLARRLPAATLASGIAPGLNEVGAFLPYSPLHHLLLRTFGAPLVATSGNISGEPVLCDDAEASMRLAAIADAFVHHDRPIARPADDSVVRVIARRPQVIRLGRGMAPLELPLPWPVREPVLAVGGHLKTTIALAWDRRVVISPHIGDMGTVRSEQVFAQVVADLQRLYRVHPERVVCDAHPAYATTRWARASGFELTTVLHHHAHASALAGEHAPRSRALLFAWDGTGYGGDGTLWGGETFLGMPGEWSRVASLRQFRLPGGERASRSPWRSAAAMCWEAGLEWPGNPADALVRTAWQRGVNVAVSSAAGRLFDAAAAIALGFHESSYEGQGPMHLEALAASAAGNEAALPMACDAEGLLRVDWSPLLANLIDKRHARVEQAAGYVHAVLARTIVQVALTIREREHFDAVGLTGGVFQNRKLTELAAAQLMSAGFDVWLHEHVPANDGGLSFGQIIESTAGAAFPSP